MTKMNFDQALSTFLELDPEHAILIRGPHGIGKSALIRAFAAALRERSTERYPVIDRRLAWMTEGDMLGLPTIEGSTTRWNPPDFIAQACREPCVLNLDEFNRATREVQNVGLQLTLDRETSSGDKLHPRTYVISSVNVGGTYQVNRMDPALLDRFFVVDLIFSFDVWLANEKASGVHQTWIDFLVAQPHLVEPILERKDPNDKGTSPRSASKCGRQLRSLLERGEAALASPTHVPGTVPFDVDAVYRIVGGFLGIPVAAAFDGHLKAHAKRQGAITGRRVYEDWCDLRREVDITRLDVLNKAVDGFIDHANGVTLTDGFNVSERIGQNFRQLLKDVPKEHRVLIYQRLMKPGKDRVAMLVALHRFGEDLLLDVFNTRPGEEGLGMKPLDPNNLAGAAE